MHGRIAPSAPAEDDLPPISYCDPAYDTVQTISPWRWLAAGALSIFCVGALLVGLLVRMGTHP